MSVASTPSGSTPTGHLTTVPADFGPTTHRTAAPSAQSTAALCAQLDNLRTALAHAEHVDGHVIDILTATVAGLATAVANTLGQQPATVTIAPARDYWRQMRLSRGWTQTEVMARLETAAASEGITLPYRDSLQIQVSRWETGKNGMSAHYRRLFVKVYDLPATGTMSRTLAVV
jgi:hypothetical protein